MPTTMKALDAERPALQVIQEAMGISRNAEDMPPFKKEPSPQAEDIPRLVKRKASPEDIPHLIKRETSPELANPGDLSDVALVPQRSAMGNGSLRVGGTALSGKVPARPLRSSFTKESPPNFPSESMVDTQPWADILPVDRRDHRYLTFRSTLRKIITHILPYLVGLLAFFLLSGVGVIIANPRFIRASLPTYSKSLSLPGSYLRMFDDLADKVASIEQAVPHKLSPDTRLNYFSVGLGVIVEPYLTSSPSPEMYKKVLRHKGWKHFDSNSRQPVRSPADVFTKWDDINDCWCALPDQFGSSQITVLLPARVFPTSLIVEHMRKEETLDWYSAPKNIELWAQVERWIAHDALGGATQNVCFEADLQSIRDHKKAVNHNHTWICIGAWEYDIHGPNNIQSFMIPLDLRGFDVSVEKVTVRATSNWGSERSTCFYRLKLFGDLAEE